MADKRGMTPPLIGVTTSEMRRGDYATLRRHGEPPMPEMALGLTYLKAVELVGGLPVVLPPVSVDHVEALLDRLDGVCLSGGPDLDPVAYGARAHEELGPTEPSLDAFELALARAADARGMPILGVCRGAQTLNVARGGTLHQHIGGHRQEELASITTQDVSVALHSRLARTMGACRMRVNSFHHQAVDRLGDGLRIAACAPDGIVEAIEDAERPFVVGVQWHAETLVDQAPHAALFLALVKAAGEHRDAGAPTLAAAA